MGTERSLKPEFLLMFDAIFHQSKETRWGLRCGHKLPALMRGGFTRASSIHAAVGPGGLQEGTGRMKARELASQDKAHFLDERRRGQGCKGNHSYPPTVSDWCPVAEQQPPWKNALSSSSPVFVAEHDVNMVGNNPLTNWSQLSQLSPLSTL